MKKIYLILLLLSLSTFAQNPAVIRSWGTYFGDERFNLLDSTIDKSGNLYIAGSIYGENTITPVFSSTNSFHPNYNGGICDGFIAKFNNLGALVWATYVGSNGADSIQGIDLDANNNIYIVGFTDSTTNISTINSFQPNIGGETDFMIAKFNQNGNQIWSSYFGGTSTEGASFLIYYDPIYRFTSQKRMQISHDKLNNFYISGYTFSNNLGTTGVFQEQKEDAVFTLSKFNNDGNRVWTSYYGFYATSYLMGLSANDNSIYVSGKTFECNFGQTPYNTYFGTVNGYQQLPSNCSDMFLSKFDTDGRRLWSTYYGGPGTDLIGSNSVKTFQDKVYITGMSFSDMVATSNTFQPLANGLMSPLLVQFNENGNRNWGTFNGTELSNQNGSVGSKSQNINLDESGNVYLGGVTALHENISTTNAYKPVITGTGIFDGFIAKFDSNGQKIWGTYYGGDQDEIELKCHPYDNNFFLVGETQSTTTMTTTGCYQSDYNIFDINAGYIRNIFIAHFEPNPLKTSIFENKNIKISPNPNNGNFKINLDNSLNENFGFEIYNILGERVHSETINQNQNEIKTNNLSKGVYLVKISKNDAVWNGKILVE